MSRKKGSFSPEDPEYEQPPEVWSKGYQTARAGSATEGSVAFVIGQRWASDMEPELGIGTVTAIESKRLTLSFQGGACVRQYSLSSSPLRRIRFKEGDSIKSRDGAEMTIESIGETNGILIYQSKGSSIPETGLSDTIRFTAPLDRLLAGHIDPDADFRLRLRALELRNRLDRSPVRGFCGPRIDLIPHQLYIAGESSSRHVRRILLADEVGLGKTIEACLILHRLLVCGRASRALVCVPQSIVHVWFVELLRKFNLIFRIVDREYFAMAAQSGKNVFLGDQLVLCDTGFLSSEDADSRQACSQAAEAGWDVLIVDEAHHVRENTPLFECVKAISERSRDVFLVTATPQQHGERSHFARLQLLDPSRYADFETFAGESRLHRSVAELTASLLDGRELDDKNREFMAGLPGMEDLAANAPQASSPAQRQRIVAELLDRFGIGRAMFRNTRAVVGGFPKRIVDIPKLKASAHCIENIRHEMLDATPVLPLADDPRFPALIDILRNFENDKILVICRHKDTAKAIEKALLRHIKVNIALFHEDLSLIQRDRNAAWFGEEEGARILICSEIGSEGRNFQFCHRLFLWDLPADCELIEQRIGRLDRIGQKQAVIIRVPCISDSSSEAMCRFFHEGIGIFENAVPAAQEVFETLGNAALSIARRAAPRRESEDQSWRQDLDGLILEAKRTTAGVSQRLESGRDRLLEMHSFRPSQAGEIIRLIREADNDNSLERFMIDLFRFHGVFAEPHEKRTYKLWSESPLDESFPALRTSRPLVTFDRAYALAREDIEFMSADHPAVRSGLDMFLGSEKGNCCCARRAGKEQGLILEAVFVVECVAPPGLQVERFLPPTPVRIVVDQKLDNRSDLVKSPEFEPSLQKCGDGSSSFLDNSEMKTTLLPAMQKRAAEFAAEASRQIIKDASGEMNRIVGAELKRITALAALILHVPQKEIDGLREEIVQLDKSISNATPRLDSIRLIWNFK
jgi:ATP-dependent helicase HepA